MRRKNPKNSREMGDSTFCTRNCEPSIDYLDWST